MKRIVVHYSCCVCFILPGLVIGPGRDERSLQRPGHRQRRQAHRRAPPSPPCTRRPAPSSRPSPASDGRFNIPASRSAAPTPSPCRWTVQAPGPDGHHPETGRGPQPQVQAGAGDHRRGSHGHRPQPDHQPVAHRRRPERQHGRHREHALDRPLVRRLRPPGPAGRLPRRRRLLGRRPEQQYNNIQIDGAVNNDLFGLSSSGTPGLAAPISLDAVQEFQLVIAPYDVRQGGFTGGRPERHHPQRHQHLRRFGLLLRPQPGLRRQGPRPDQAYGDLQREAVRPPRRRPDHQGQALLLPQRRDGRPNDPDHLRHRRQRHLQRLRRRQRHHGRRPALRQHPEEQVRLRSGRLRRRLQGRHLRTTTRSSSASTTTSATSTA